MSDSSDAALFPSFTRWSGRTTRLLVGPEIGNRMREIIAEYTAEEVYSTKRQEIQDGSAATRRPCWRVGS